MNILALDLSTKKTGYAVFADKKLKDYGLMTVEGDNYQERIRLVRENIIKKIKETKIDMIVLEEVPMNAGSNLKVAHDLCVCQGAVLGICCQLNLGLRLYFPTQWRSVMGTYDGTRTTTKRVVQKQKAVDLVNQLYGTDFKYYEKESIKRKEFSDDDICEAILLGIAHIKESEINE